MNSAALPTEISPESVATDEGFEYRTVPSGAVAGLVLGVFSAVTIFGAMSSLQNSLLLTPIPVVAFFISMQSLAKIRRDPANYTGAHVAIAGAACSVFFLLAGVGYGAYVHVTEVPPEHTRITFQEMRPDTIQERSGVVVPPEIMALDGKRVFIKGYMRPPEVRTGIDQFLLVRDNNQCCFGDLSSVKYYDRILVALKGKLRLTYSENLYAIGGVLRIIPQNAAFGAQATVFALEADHAK
jgi:hypothetical protein